MSSSNLPETSELGKKSSYKTTYDPSLLYPIPRKLNRDKIGVPSSLPFEGVDQWTAFELSWLNSKGRPTAAIANFTIPCFSENIIESKSFKLYLNSFNQTKFENVDQVKEILKNDISKKVQAEIHLSIFLEEEFDSLSIGKWEGKCIDYQDIEIDTYTINSSFLTCHSDLIVEEKLHSHLLKSNCLVTNQPDWGSLYIHYTGKQIDHEGLLKYVISFRNVNEFAEQCVERIYMDILHACQPEKLTVYARYTRRGGLDINPFRSNFETISENTRLARQ